MLAAYGDSTMRTGTTRGRAIAAALGLLALAGASACGGGDGGSADIEEGERLFKANCAACHGLEAAGTQSGPPLVHPYYAPGHHNDAAFRRAARDGVPQHHWFFGDMPPVAGVSDEEIERIIAYVREIQRANGIE